MNESEKIRRRPVFAVSIFCVVCFKDFVFKMGINNNGLLL